MADPSPRGRDDTQPRLHRWLVAAESAGGQGLGWLWLLLGWILARTLLEGIIEQPRALGFDWREDLSTAMVFLHFPLFYLLLFTGVVLVLHVAARRPLSSAVRAVALAFGILLLAPILDLAVSRGRGYDLKYLLGFGSVLWRFWDPRVPLAEVSPGQRVEIVLACLLGGAYVWAARRRVFPAVAAAVVIYLLAAFAGAWPSLFASGTQEGAATAGEAYRQTFQGPGLIAGESRRHAVVMALPLLALLPVLAWRADPRRFRAVVAGLSRTRLVYYAGLVPAGAWIGAVLYAPYLSDRLTARSAPATAESVAEVDSTAREALSLFHPGDLAALVVLTAAMLLAVLAATCANDLADRAADSISEPRRPLVSGLLEPEDVSRLGALLAAGSLLLALCVSYVAFLLVLACLLLAAAYSLPPLRLKRVPFLATGALAALSLLSAMTGFSLLAQEAAPVAFPGRIALALFLGVTLGFNAKDLKDAEGDAQTGVRTLATLLPPRSARLAAGALVAISYLLVPLLLPLGTAGIAAAVGFAALGALLVWRLRRPDSALLGAFCVFAVLLLALLPAHPAALRDRRTEAFLVAHAALLHTEEKARAAGLDEFGAGSAAPGAESAAPGDRAIVPPFAESLRRVLTARAAGLSPASFEWRLWWSAARLRDPEAEAAAAKLVHDRPLEPRHHQALIECRLDRTIPAAPAAPAAAALRLGLRPAWFLRQLAAARLAEAGGAEPASPRRMLQRNSALDAAERHLRGALLLAGPTSPLLVLAGDLHARRRDWIAAERAFEESVRLDPLGADGWAGLGQSRHSLGALDAAVGDFLRAASLRPGDPWIRNNLAVALRDAGRTVEARAQFGEARRLAPRMFEPVYNLALLEEREGRVEEARARLREARELQPGFPPLDEAMRRLGIAPPLPPGAPDSAPSPAGGSESRHDPIRPRAPISGRSAAAPPG